MVKTTDAPDLNTMLDDQIYHDLDTVHEWLSARGYTSEALACFNALNRLHKLTRGAQKPVDRNEEPGAN